jgi:hypothetical protein
MPKKLTLTQKVDLLVSKLDEVHKDLEKNTKDIEELKEQVNMGKGGIRAIFIFGAMIAAVFTIFKFGLLVK